MKFLSVGDLRSKPAEAWSGLAAAKAVAAVSEMQRRSVERGLDGISMDEIDAEIAAARSARRRDRP